MEMARNWQWSPPVNCAWFAATVYATVTGDVVDGTDSVPKFGITWDVYTPRGVSKAIVKLNGNKLTNLTAQMTREIKAASYKAGNGPSPTPGH